MLCPDCQTEIPGAETADVKICPICQASAKKRRRRVPKLKPKSSQIKYRMDGSHQDGTATPGGHEQENLSFVKSWLNSRPATHAAVFGLLIFLIGQAVHVWAFLVGNYFAWSAANLMTVAGIALAVVSIVKTLDNLAKRLDSLAKRDNVPRKKVRRPAQQHLER